MRKTRNIYIYIFTGTKVLCITLKNIIKVNQDQFLTHSIKIQIQMVHSDTKLKSFC